MTIKNNTKSITTSETSTGDEAAASEATSTLPYTVGEVVEVDPASLLLLSNIREATPDKGLIASIKDVGVLQPIVALLTPEGALLVRYGHSRTLAACEAGRATVPVYVAGHVGDQADEKATQAAEVERIITQRDENTHRAGLTTRDELGVVGQLAAFGMSPAAIAKKTRMTRATVDTSLAVLESDLAKAATARYTDLTLDQAAAVAEFEDDAETVKALVVATKTGQFDHVAQRARDKRAEADAKAALVAQAEAAGAIIIPTPGRQDAPTALSDLIAQEDDQTPLTTAEHATCPGHCAWLTPGWVWLDAEGNQLPDDFEPDYDEDEDDDADGQGDDQDDETGGEPAAGMRQVYGFLIRYGCTDPAAHGHLPRWGWSPSSTRTPAAQLSEADREAAKTARRLVIDNNKAWVSAETVRRAWVRTFLARKTAPKGTAAFLTEALVRDGDMLGSVGGNHLATTWFGGKTPTYGHSQDVAQQGQKATEARALVLTLGYVLACHEERLTKDSWRRDGTDNAAGRYLRFLGTCGYELSDVETFAASKKTA